MNIDQGHDRVAVQVQMQSRLIAEVLCPDHTCITAFTFNDVFRTQTNLRTLVVPAE